MALREQPLPISFAGLNRKNDPKQVPAAQLVDLQNAVFTNFPALSKRNGYEDLSTLIDETDVGYGSPNALGRTTSDELIAFSNGRAYSYRPSADRWADAGEVSSVVAETLPLARTGTVQAIPDVAIKNGIQVFAWEDSRGGVWCEVLEEATGRVLLTQTQLDANGRTPRCVFSDDSLLVLWTKPTQHEIWVSVVNTSDPGAVPTSMLIVSDLSPTNPVFDAESCGPWTGAGSISGEPAVIAWALDTVGFKLAYLHRSGALGSSGTGLPAVTNFADAVDGPIAVTPARADGCIAVLWHGGQVRMRVVLASDFTTTIRTAALGSAGGNSVRLVACFGRRTSPLEYQLWWALQRSSGRTDQSVVTSGRADLVSATHDATETTLRGHEIMSRAFYDGPELILDTAFVDTATNPSGDVYVMLAGGFRLFPYVAAVRLSSDTGITGGDVTCVARLLPGEGPATHFRRIAAGPTGFERIKHVSSVVDRGRVSTNFSSRHHAAPLSYRITLDSANGDQFAELGIKYASLDFDNDAAYQTASLDRGLYLASACPQHYDADRWVEAGYHTAPDWGYNADGSAYDPAGAFVPVAGGAVADGTYLYKLWFEDIDAQGELHRGPVSAGVLVTTGGGNNTVRITFPHLWLTNKRRVRMCVARSIVGATGDDESIALYRVTGIDPSVTTGANCMLFNDPTTASTTFDDNLTDAQLLTREPLYTNGGIRSNDPAPWAGNCIAVGKGRLFWTDPTDPHLVRHSKSAIDDIALEAPSSFSIKTDPTGGKIVGLWVMDDVVYVGKETEVHAFTGPGPLPAPDILPEQNAFTPPGLVTTDVGLENASSVGVIPIGTLFKTAKGIVLLDRSRQIQRVGSMVDGFNDQRVMRTTLLPDRPHVVCLTDSGRSLLFDYERGLWSTFTNHEGYDAVMLGGVYHYLRTDGRVFKETPGVYRDDQTHIPMLIETAPIKVAGYLQGFQSVLWAYWIGKYLSPHTLRMSFKLDYSELWLGPIDMDVNVNFDPSLYGDGIYGAGLYGTTDFDPSTLYARRVHLNQRGLSIAFRLEDVEGADDFGACFELSELMLVCGVLGAKPPLGAARSG